MPTIPPCLIMDLLVQTPLRICRSRLYWLPDTPPTGSTDMVAVADDAFQQFQDPLTDCLSISAKFTAVYVKYRGATTEYDGWSTASAALGSQGALLLPDETCFEIQRRTGMPGRQNRGRLFFSGLFTGDQVDGVTTTGALARQKALAAMIGPDQTFTGIGLCHARHWDRKDNVLRGVQAARVVSGLVSRRDRRKPLEIIPR